MLETSWQVCWGKLELNSAGHRPSRTKFGHPCFKQSNILNGLYFCPSQPHFHSKIITISSVSVIIVYWWLLSSIQHPHAGPAGSYSGPSLRELPLGAPQTGRQVVLPWLYSASVACVRTALLVFLHLLPQPPWKKNSFVSVATEYLNIPNLARLSGCIKIAHFYIVTSHFF